VAVGDGWSPEKPRVIDDSGAAGGRGLLGRRLVTKRLEAA
jgi:hypothetical protein